MIHEAGFKEVEGLQGKDTNASQTEIYDRIFLTSNEYFVLGKTSTGIENGGVFNPFQAVFTDKETGNYKEDMNIQYTGKKNLDEGDNLQGYYMHPWRKNQISDHYPIWIELIIDSADVFLQKKLDAFPG